MNKLYILITLFLMNLIISKAHSFSSSSYLIANSAMFFYDYDQAQSEYKKNLDILEDIDLEKKLLAFVNSGFFYEAVDIAEKIIEIDEYNLKGWLVYLVNAKINNLKNPFNIIARVKNQDKLKVINYIFYDNEKLIDNKITISNKIIELIRTSFSQNTFQIQNYDYLLFYLSLSTTLNNSNSDAFFYSAQVYENLKNYKKAEYFYNRVSKNHSLYLESRKKIALNKRFQKSINESEEALIELIKENPNNINLLIDTAAFYRITKQYNKAISFYTNIISSNEIENDQLWGLLYFRGICYEKIDQWDLAVNDFKSSLSINPDSPQVLNYLAYGWLERNIFLDQSLEMLQKAHEKYPESHYILDSLGWAYYKKNNYQKASELMEEVLNIAPDEAISLDHLGDIYYALGRKREALYMWSQAKDLAKPDDKIIDNIMLKLKKHNAG